MLFCFPTAVALSSGSCRAEQDHRARVFAPTGTKPHALPLARSSTLLRHSRGCSLSLHFKNMLENKMKAARDVPRRQMLEKVPC